MGTLTGLDRVALFQWALPGHRAHPSGGDESASNAHGQWAVPLRHSSPYSVLLSTINKNHHHLSKKPSFSFIHLFFLLRYPHFLRHLQVSSLWTIPFNSGRLQLHSFAELEPSIHSLPHPHLNQPPPPVYRYPHSHSKRPEHDCVDCSSDSGTRLQRAYSLLDPFTASLCV